MPHVDPGELRYRATILIPQRSIDANGHYVTTDQRVTVRCGVRAAKGDEQVIDDSARRVERLQFIVRYRTDVNSDCAIEWRGQRYEITFVDPAPWAGSYMRIRAESVDAPVGS